MQADLLGMPADFRINLHFNWAALSSYHSCEEIKDFDRRETWGKYAKYVSKRLDLFERAFSHLALEVNLGFPKDNPDLPKCVDAVMISNVVHIALTIQRDDFIPVGKTHYDLFAPSQG